MFIRSTLLNCKPISNEAKASDAEYGKDGRGYKSLEVANHDKWGGTIWRVEINHLFQAQFVVRGKQIKAVALKSIFGVVASGSFFAVFMGSYSQE